MILEKQLSRRPLKALEDQLRDFHQVANQPIGRSPQVRDADLRSRLIIEEAIELCVALLKSEMSGVEAGLRVSEIFDTAMKHCVSTGKLSDTTDQVELLAEVVDGQADLLYVTIGTAVACGTPMDPFWNEVHRSNMQKAGAPLVDGKIMKPRGWRPPQVRAILESLRPAISDELKQWSPS